MTSWALVIAVWSAAADRPPAAPDRRPATMAAAEVRARVESARQRLRSLCVEYLGTGARDGRVADSVTILRTVAAKARCRYLFSVRAPGGQPDPNDRRQVHSLYDGRSWNAYHPYSRIYETSQRFSNDNYTIKAKGDPFYESLGWWPPDDPSAAPMMLGHPFFLHVLLAKDPGRVAAEQERVGDRWCHVLEVGGRHRLWVDEDGWLHRREFSAGTPPRPTMRYELLDQRPVADGVRLPHDVHRFELDPATGAVVRDMRYQVRRCEVNTVPDSRFTFTPTPGVVVYDRDTDQAAQVPGGLDFLDVTVGRVRDQLPADPPPGPGFPWLACALGAAVGGAGVAVGRRAVARL